MAEKKSKEEMTEEYKKALEEKQAKEAKEREERTLQEMKQKKSMVQARREAEKLKKELETKRIEEKIAECDAEIKKAEKTIESGQLYELIGKITLYISIVFLIVTILMVATSMVKAYNIVAPLTAALVILAISIFFQSRQLFAESKRRKNVLKKRQLKQALYEVKNRH